MAKKKANKQSFQGSAKPQDMADVSLSQTLMERLRQRVNPRQSTNTSRTGRLSSNISQLIPWAESTRLSMAVPPELLNSRKRSTADRRFVSDGFDQFSSVPVAGSASSKSGKHKLFSALKSPMKHVQSPAEHQGASSSRRRQAADEIVPSSDKEELEQVALRRTESPEIPTQGTTPKSSASQQKSNEKDVSEESEDESLKSQASGVAVPVNERSSRKKFSLSSSHQEGLSPSVTSASGDDTDQEWEEVNTTSNKVTTVKKRLTVSGVTTEGKRSQSLLESSKKAIHSFSKPTESVSTSLSSGAVSVRKAPEKLFANISGEEQPATLSRELERSAEKVALPDRKRFNVSAAAVLSGRRAGAKVDQTSSLTKVRRRNTTEPSSAKVSMAKISDSLKQSRVSATNNNSGMRHSKNVDTLVASVGDSVNEMGETGSLDEEASVSIPKSLREKAVTRRKKASSSSVSRSSKDDSDVEESSEVEGRSRQNALQFIKQKASGDVSLPSKRQRVSTCDVEAHMHDWNFVQDHVLLSRTPFALDNEATEYIRHLKEKDHDQTKNKLPHSIVSKMISKLNHEMDLELSLRHSQTKIRNLLERLDRLRRFEVRPDTHLPDLNTSRDLQECLDSYPDAWDVSESDSDDFKSATERYALLKRQLVHLTAQLQEEKIKSAKRKAFAGKLQQVEALMETQTCDQMNAEIKRTESLVSRVRTVLEKQSERGNMNPTQILAHHSRSLPQPATHQEIIHKLFSTT